MTLDINSEIEFLKYLKYLLIQQVDFQVSNATYVQDRKAKNKDLSEQSQAFSVEQFAKHCHLHAGTDSDEQPDVDEAGDGDTDETIIEPNYIELLTLQVSCSTSMAMTH